MARKQLNLTASVGGRADSSNCAAPARWSGARGNTTAAAAHLPASGTSMADLTQRRPVLASNAQSRAIPLHLAPPWPSLASCLYSQPRATSSSVLENPIASADLSWVLPCSSSTSSTPLCSNDATATTSAPASPTSPPAAFESPWPRPRRCSSSIHGKRSQACTCSSSSLPWRLQAHPTIWQTPKLRGGRRGGGRLAPRRRSWAGEARTAAKGRAAESGRASTTSQSPGIWRPAGGDHHLCFLFLSGGGRDGLGVLRPSGPMNERFVFLLYEYLTSGVRVNCTK